MNATRRKQIAKLADALNDAASELESVISDIEQAAEE